MARVAEASSAGVWRIRSTAWRWTRLFTGLWVFAVGIALMVRAELGVSSWDVLHDAVRRITPLTFGQAVIALSVTVVVGSLALGVKPGPGTIANVFLVGAFTDAILASTILAPLGSSLLIARLAGLMAGVGAIALGSALYIGAELGAGPRDSLMLGLASRLGTSPGAARAGIEGSVLVVGALMGGAIGLGTAIFAVLIGPAINIAFRMFGMQTHSSNTHVVARFAGRVDDWGRRGQLGSSASIDVGRATGARC